MEMDGGNKEDYGRCQEIFFSKVLARPKYFQPFRGEVFRDQKYFFHTYLHTVKLLTFSKLQNTEHSVNKFIWFKTLKQPMRWTKAKYD